MIGYNDAFCEVCQGDLMLYNGNFSVEHADAFTACCVYDGIAKKAVLTFKRDACGNAYYAFACGIFRKLREMNRCVDLVTCIPMFRADLEKRGYNQSELIAKELRYLLHVPYADVLKKCRKTLSQKSLSGRERRGNLAGAFTVNDPERVRKKTVLVVDDVCTTGSTLSEAARVLKEAGASQVIAAAFAKTNGQSISDSEKGVL